MRNIRLTIEFDGIGFSGWQFQPDRRTVQHELQAAIARATQQPVTVYGCSRTDAGVSASNYVANFHTESGFAPERLRRALNYHLPKEIHIKTAAEVGPGFHARFSARSKTYLYQLVRGCSPLRRSRVWELHHPVDPARMEHSLRLFRGRKDFRKLCLTRAQSGICNVMRLELSEYGDELQVLIQADRFLYKMVRRIIGAAVTYGSGRITLADIRAALAGRKHRPFRTAPASGLVLDSVEY